MRNSTDVSTSARELAESWIDRIKAGILEEMHIMYHELLKRELPPAPHDHVCHPPSSLTFAKQQSVETHADFGAPLETRLAKTVQQTTQPTYK